MRRATTARNAWTKSKQYERKRKDTRWVLWELVVLLQRRRILGTDWYGVLALVEKKGVAGYQLHHPYIKALLAFSHRDLRIAVSDDIGESGSARIARKQQAASAPAWRQAAAAA